MKTWSVIKVNGVAYSLIETVFSKGALKRRMEVHNHNRYDICPICRQEINEPGQVMLAGNNYRVFPSIFIHKGCALTFGCSMENLFKHLEHDWDEAQKYRCWF